MKLKILGVVTLVVGGLALLLGIVPAMILGQEKPKPPPVKTDTMAEFAVGKVRIAVGKKPTDESAIEQVATEDSRETYLRTFWAVSMGLAIVGLVLGPIAWVREDQRVISGSGLALCAAALVWQYVIAGIVIGVAIAILLVVLANM